MSKNDRARVLDEIRAHFNESFPGPRANQASLLAQLFFRRIPDEELADAPIEDLCGMIHSLLRFVQQRLPGQALVRVYNADTERDGWQSQHTIIEVLADDMPFLVDSIGMVIADHDFTSYLVVHPTLAIQRDAGGQVLELHEDGDSEAEASLESLMQFQITRTTDPGKLKKLHAGIEKALADVNAAVNDWRDMRTTAEQVGKDLADSANGDEERQEAADFLAWLADDHFTFLGYRYYRIVEENGESKLKTEADSGLGILGHSGEPKSRPLTELSDTARANSKSGKPLIVTKTNARGTVHRPGYMDYIGVMSYDESGAVDGEHRFLGLYTSNAYNRRPWNTPYVRRKVAAVMERSGLRSQGHGGKALLHILETLPRDELFQASVEELYELAVGVLNLQERQRTWLYIRRDAYGRFFSCIVFIPRERFNTDTRERIQGILKRALRGDRVDYNVQLGDSVLARLHVVIRMREGDEPKYNVDDLERRIQETVRSWHDELNAILLDRYGEEQGAQMAERYTPTFPPGYVDDVTPWVASFDVENVSLLKDANDLRMSLYRPRKRTPRVFRFKVFKYDRTIPLSHALPMLENMGLHIVSERPYELLLDDGTRVWIQDFDMQLDGADAIDLEDVRQPFQDAFEKTWRGEAEDDGFNRLILEARLEWRQVAILRACCKYLLQTSIPYSQAYMERTLAANALFARLLVELFEARFDPSFDGCGKNAREAAKRALRKAFAALADEQDAVLGRRLEAVIEGRDENRAHQQLACEAALRHILNNVHSMDEDRMLRAFAELIQAMLRTNYFQTHADGRPRGYISMKLNSGQVPDLPEPKPWREIFVYSPQIEGVHLRGGPVARGGLRWSDRFEDFRTEVLGLMKAQMVKNTLIVPVGAKGGFVVKRLPKGDRDQVMAEVVACYRFFINGLLDVTDNLKDGEVLHPPEVVRHDDDDTYLVVAADKGTASFSDIANAVAENHGFWLGDAFASGGSVGYDHKGMGITARGAWESVKRHFREMGKDTQSEPFSCVGIGDMSGDVFGNGMLLSPHIQLKAAFNHMHVFLDPNPDCATSFAERKRLFDLPRSSWEDYDPEKISTGGGVYSRQAKSIPLSQPVREWLGISETELNPQALVRELLKAPVDLLWNGGIGTYVKSSSENNADVGDRANDAVRVNGADLRCKVVGEGGNLGMTQAGRIEFAVNGGRINTDSIDNSAGVDCSDHEVNIKILLNLGMAEGKLDTAERRKLLAEMTDEVAELVLRNNYLQTQSISMMETLSADRLGAKAHFIRVLENEDVIDRELERLPSDEDLTERRARGLGLTRPELAVLLAYGKITVYDALLKSDVPEDPYLSLELERYFPRPLQERFREEMANHYLRREIIATHVTNSMVNRMGATFSMRMEEDSGATPAAVARAYTVAREVFRARNLWEQIEALDNQVPARLQMNLVLRVWNLLRQATRWLLTRRGHHLDIAAEVKHFGPGVDELRRRLESVVVETTRKQYGNDVSSLVSQGIGEELAQQVVGFPSLYAALDIVEVSHESGLGVTEVAQVYFQLGNSMKLKWLRRQVERLAVDGQWHAHARGALRDELYRQHRRLTAHILAGRSAGADPTQAVKGWMRAHEQEVSRTLQMLSDMRSLASMDYATVSVAIRGLENLVHIASGGE